MWPDGEETPAQTARRRAKSAQQLSRDAPVSPEKKDDTGVYPLSSNSKAAQEVAAPETMAQPADSSCPGGPAVTLIKDGEGPPKPKKAAEMPASESFKHKSVPVHSILTTTPCGMSVTGWWGSAFMDLQSWLRMAELTPQQLNDRALEVQTVRGKGVLVFTHQRDQGSLRYHSQSEYEAWDKDCPQPEGGIEVLLFRC